MDEENRMRNNMQYGCKSKEMPIVNMPCGCKDREMPIMQMPSVCETNERNIENVNCCCNDNEMTRREMIRKIKCYKFAIKDLALYLDTHPDDVRALCLHRKYCNELKDLEDRYQRKYGPLTIYYPCNKWRWIEEPWPWERGNF